jgi:hypothetical protein
MFQCLYKFKSYSVKFSPLPLHFGVPGQINTEQLSPSNPPWHTQTDSSLSLIQRP